MLGHDHSDTANILHSRQLHLWLSTQLVNDGPKALQALGNLWLIDAVLTSVVALTSVNTSERLGMLRAPRINDIDRIKQFRALNTVKFP